MRSPVFVILLLLTAFTVACGDEDSGDSTAGSVSNQSTDDVAQGLRVFYLLPSPATVDIKIISDEDDGTALELTNVAASEVSTYQNLPTGSYRALFFKGGTQEPLTPPVSVNGITIESDTLKTLVLTQGTDDDPSYQVLTDEIALPSENGARFRFIYRAVGPRVDLYKKSDGALFEAGFSLGQVTPYGDVSGGTYSFEVRPEGNPEVVYAIDNLQLKPSNVYTVFITGDLDPDDNGDYSDNTLSHVLATDWVFD